MTMVASCCGQSECKDEKAEGSNAVIENIMARRSIRAYKQVPVSRDTLNMIMQCGINAPNGQNKQSWEVRVVDKPELMEEIKDAMANACEGLFP